MTPQNGVIRTPETMHNHPPDRVIKTLERVAETTPNHQIDNPKKSTMTARKGP